MIWEKSSIIYSNCYRIFDYDITHACTLIFESNHFKKNIFSNITIILVHSNLTAKRPDCYPLFDTVSSLYEMFRSFKNLFYHINWRIIGFSFRNKSFIFFLYCLRQFLEGSNGTKGISRWIHSYYIVIEKEFEKRYDNQLLDVFRYVFCRNSDLEIERKKSQ